MQLDCTAGELDLLHRGLSSYAYIIQQDTRLDTTPDAIVLREERLATIRTLADRVFQTMMASTHDRSTGGR